VNAPPPAAGHLRVVIRTPHEALLDLPAVSLRVPTDTGQVGFHRGVEPLVLAVQVGLVLVGTGAATRYVGVAGGLLSCDGQEATLFTPLAVMGEDPEDVERALSRALAEPGAELSLRAALERLEGRIVTELRQRSGARVPEPGEWA